MDNLIKKRIAVIDILKGIAIVGVIMVHFNNFLPSPNGILFSISRLGAYGPQLFFIVSAFLLWKKLSNCEFNKASILKFYSSKFSRILPPYIIAILLYAFILDNVSFTNPSVYLHLSLLNGFFPQYINDVMGVEWYVFDYLLLILITPFLVKYVNNLKKSLFNFGFWFILSCILSLITHSLIKVDLNYDYTTFLNVFFIIVQMPVISLGFIIYFIFKAITSYNKKQSMIFYLLSYSAFVGLIYGLFKISNRIGIDLISDSLLMGSRWSWIFMLSLIISQYIRPKTFKIFHPFSVCFSFLGKYSYGIYLFHMLILRFVPHLMPITTLYWVFILSIVIMLSLVAGVGLEKISYKLKNVILDIERKNIINIFSK